MSGFNGWSEHVSKEESKIKNNCMIWCSDPTDSETFGGLINWLKTCPVWIVVKLGMMIKRGEEFLTDYY